MGKISSQDLARYAVNQLHAGASMSDVSEQIAAFLLEERRTKDAASVLRAIEVELDQRGNTQLVITSVHGVSDQIKSQLASLLDVENPTYSEVIDPSVIGGVKAKAGDKLVDLTIETKLKRFKSQVMRSK